MEKSQVTANLTIGRSSGMPVVTFRRLNHVATLPVERRIAKVKPKEYVPSEKLATEVALEYAAQAPRTTKLIKPPMVSYTYPLTDTADVTDMANRDVFRLVDGCPEPPDRTRLLDQAFHCKRERFLKPATTINFADCASLDKEAPTLNFLKRNLSYVRPLSSLKRLDNLTSNLKDKAPSPVKTLQSEPMPTDDDVVNNFPKLYPRDTSPLPNGSASQSFLASLQLYSVRNSLLPSLHQVELHFYVVFHNRKTGAFVKCSYLPGTEQIVPINHHNNLLITLAVPFDITAMIKTPDNVAYLLVRANFVQDSPRLDDIRTNRGTTSRRSMPTENKTRNLGQLHGNDGVMFGADEISVDTASDLSLILISADDLGISSIFDDLSKDATLISRIQAAAKQLRANPFIILSINFTSTMTRKRTLAEAAKDDKTPDYVNLYFLYVYSFDSAYAPNPAPLYPKIGNSKTFLESEMAKKLAQVSKAYTAATKKDMPRCFNYRLSRDYNCVFCSMNFDHIVALIGHLTRCHSRLDYRFVKYFNFEDDTVLPAIIMTPDYLNSSVDNDRKDRNFCLFKRRSYTNSFSELIQHFVSMDWKSVPYNMPLEKWVATPRRLKAYGKTTEGRSIKKAPPFLVQQMRRSLNDIVDLEHTEKLFSLDWNTFCLEYGPLSGYETNPYRLCNAYVVKRREFISKNFLQISFLSMLTHLVASNRISAMESYDITMQLQRNYQSCNDVAHPLTHQAVYFYESNIRKEVRKQKEREKEMKRANSSNQSTVCLRSRIAGTPSASDDVTFPSGIDTPNTPPA